MQLTILFFLFPIILSAVPQIPQIYGVRWFLGDYYIPSPRLSSQTHFVLMFNSQQAILKQISVKIESINRYSCSQQLLSSEALSDHHKEYNPNSAKKGDLFETYLYTCYISEPILGQSVQYSIQMGTLASKSPQSQPSPPITHYLYTSLFSSSFRPVPKEQSLSAFNTLVIGDWGQLTSIGLSKGYTPLFPCLNDSLSSANLFLFAGDLAYDFQNELYISMLKYMQPITSIICTIVTPGNHDSLYHADTFELFTLSFYTPMWEHYYNYFSLLQVNGVVFLSYNPEAIMFAQSHQFNQVHRIKESIGQIMAQELNSDILIYLRNYSVVVYSHYPIYCSDLNDDLDSCGKNVERTKEIREKFFEKMNVKIYISGHLHLYERSHPICADGVVVKEVNGDGENGGNGGNGDGGNGGNGDGGNGDGGNGGNGDGGNGGSNSATTSTTPTPTTTSTTPTPTTTSTTPTSIYPQGCTVYVVQGSGGNNYYVQTDYLYPPKSFSARMVYNTGFGVLSISNTTAYNLIYKHISAKECNTTDQLRMITAKKLNLHYGSPQQTTSILGVALATLFLMQVSGCIQWIRVRIRRRMASE